MIEVFEMVPVTGLCPCGWKGFGCYKKDNEEEYLKQDLVLKASHSNFKTKNGKTCHRAPIIEPNCL